ncbi:rhodanese-like domain-containing protein [Corallococcus carmarthensis]|uniref:rhodanese-like domain-containing protein n=1 Tax=Corallococcus carmarthensis TaxID=2316728 RepID=UPI00148DC5B6|nr:rhodanese-like domain-containing protein [Corallococcus carmarthensis]NOK19505.1 rhodanese-like domain-containing protein [Corallococcus carmarthensis]
MTTPPPEPSVPANSLLFQLKWKAELRASGAMTPRVPVQFVAEQGRAIRVIDIRDKEELTGMMGHIPASLWVPLDRIAEVYQQLGPDVPVVLVSHSGRRAGLAAQYLHALGMQYVAALSGGMIAWRTAGYSTSRHATIFERALTTPTFTAEEGPATGPLKQEHIERHVGDPSQVRWARLSALLMTGRRSCVDGRDEQGVIGTPGGDAGEFLLALAAVENITGTVFDDKMVEELLFQELEVFGRFYMHTDTSAWGRLVAALAADPRLSGQRLPPRDDEEAWHTFVDHPPAEARPVVMEHLLEPAHLGCGHLKLMLTRPQDYGVRPDLVRSFLRAFHDLRWQGVPELEFVTLSGVHDEAAVLTVYVEEDLWDMTSIPLVSPSVGPKQVFVAHPQVAAKHRDHYVEFFRRLPRWVKVEPHQVEPLRTEMNALAATQLGHTLKSLANGLPIFEARFEGPETVRVLEAGKV